MDKEKQYFVISKLSNIVLRARKIKSGFTLFFDIHIDKKRYTEYLHLAVSTLDVKRQTQTDKDMIRIAKRLQAKRVIDIAEGNYQKNKIITIDTNFVKYYNMLSEEQVKNKTKSKYKWMSSYKHFANFIGNKRITFADINRTILEQYKSYLLGQVKNNTASSYFTILSEVLESARKDDIIKSNPMKDIKGIKRSESLKTYLTFEELQKIANLNDKDLEDYGHGNLIITKLAFVFSCFTGIRVTDIRNLKKNQIKNENGNYFLFFISQKSKKSDRMKLHDMAIKQLDLDNKDEMLFPKLVSKRHINDHVRELSKRAGLDKSITFHCAKHTFATLALNAGVDIYTLKELLHHSDIRTTEIYAKLLGESKIKAIDMLPNL